MVVDDTTAPAATAAAAPSGDGLSALAMQQVTDIIQSTMTASVEGVVAKISAAYQPQMVQAAAARTAAQADAAKAQKALEALQAQTAAAELARQASLLPPRSIDDEQKANARVRGHARNPGRLEELRRQLVGKGLTEEQLQRVANMMDDNQKVPVLSPFPSSSMHVPPTAWALGALGGVGSASFATGPGGPADDLFARVQAQGFAAPDEPKTQMEVLAVTLAAAANGGKAPKKFTLPASYKAWVAKLREEGWTSPSLHDTNPKYYWALEWIRQTVEYVNFQHSWQVASLYFEHVMFEWGKLWLDPSTWSVTEEFRRGHIAAAVHPRLLEQARTESSKGKSASGSASKWERKGTKARVNASDTWCGCHEMYYEEEDDHHWDTATQTGTCKVANAGKKKKKK